MACVLGKLLTDIVPLIGCVTPLPSTGCLPETKVGVLLAIVDSDVLAVVCNALVAAPFNVPKLAVTIPVTVGVPAWVVFVAIVAKLPLS